MVTGESNDINAGYVTDPARKNASVEIAPGQGFNMFHQLIHHGGMVFRFCTPAFRAVSKIKQLITCNLTVRAMHDQSPVFGANGSLTSPVNPPGSCLLMEKGWNEYPKQCIMS